MVAGAASFVSGMDFDRWFPLVAWRSMWRFSKSTRTKVLEHCGYWQVKTSFDVWFS